MPLLALAQDPKPVPYNADFRGYIRVQSLRAKVSKTSTMGYVLVDTTTGQEYAVSLSAIATDTSNFINARYGNNTMYQDFIFNKNIIDNSTNINKNNSNFNFIRNCLYGITMNNSDYNDINGGYYGLIIDTSYGNTVRGCQGLKIRNNSNNNILFRWDNEVRYSSNNFAVNGGDGATVDTSNYNVILNCQSTSFNKVNGSVFINQNYKTISNVDSVTYIGKDIFFTDLDTSKQLMQLYFNPTTKQVTCGDTLQGGGGISGTLTATRVPYASGTSSLKDESVFRYNDTTNTLIVDTWQPNTAISVPTYNKGLVYWDNTDNALSYHTDISGTSIQIGQEMVVRVINKTGSTITNGQVVYISGAQGNRAKVSLAKADAESTSEGTLGIATSNISNDTTGYITTSGLVRYLNTNGLGVGSKLYLSTSTAGAFTTTEPVAPNHRVVLGQVVVDHPTHGQIYVNVDDGEEIKELHDVLITSPRNQAVLMYDSITGVWKDTINDATLWSKKGNTLATDSSDWLGSKNSQPLIFKTNNIERARFVGGTGRFGIGTTTPLTMFQVNSTLTARPRGLSIMQTTNDANGAYINLFKNRNSATITTNDSLGGILAWGYDGTRNVASSAIHFINTGTIGTRQVGGEIHIQTGTAASPTVLTDRITIKNTGTINFGTGGGQVEKYNFDGRVASSGYFISDVGFFGASHKSNGGGGAYLNLDGGDEANLLHNSDNTLTKLSIGGSYSTYTIDINGQGSRSIGMERHATANTAGNSLTLISGGTTSGATDKAPGDFTNSTGVGTGLAGISAIRNKTLTTVDTSGTTDGVTYDRLNVLSTIHLSDNTAKTIFTQKLGLDSLTSGQMKYSVTCRVGNSGQVITGELWYIVNESTVTCDVISKFPSTLAVGTLDLSCSGSVASNTLTLTITADSSLNPVSGTNDLFITIPAHFIGERNSNPTY